MHYLKSLAILTAAGSWLTMSNAAEKEIQLSLIGNYRTGVFDEGAAEIVAHDPKTQRLFFVNAADSSIDILDINDPTNPTLVGSIALTPYGDQANSVAFHHGVLAAAMQAEVRTDPGSVVFFDSAGNFLNSVQVGALPDMLTFTPDGKKVLVANEGEPSDDYLTDPEGSVSIIDVSKHVSTITQADVRTASFSMFNLLPLDSSVRVYGPAATAAQDFEPEYITASRDSKRAWVTLQENNAIAVIDLESGLVVDVVGLGFKDHLQPGSALDPSDRDGGIRIGNWPVHGMFQPDAIASFKILGKEYLITANEGDARDYDGFAEEARVSSLTLDPVAFPNAAVLKANANLGRLTVTQALGDFDGDGDYDALFPLGARSFSIWSADVGLVYDSGDGLERLTALAYPSFFNSDNTDNNFDNRSDNKGPEPEGLTIGTIQGQTYAFIGLERIGGVIVYNVTNPASPKFVQYINPRNFAGDPEADTAGDLGPEGLHFVEKHESPIAEPLLIVANEVSGSISIYSISK